MSANQGQTSPLDGIRILDLTIYQNGPWGTVMLSDMGAEVIKIEDPVNGDPGRNAMLNLAKAKEMGISPYFQTMNRNKKSMTLNLKAPEGRQIFYEMVKKADVVTQNFRHGVAARLKIDYDTLAQYNPKVICVSNTGFGRKGPHSQHGVFDILGQARSGYIWVSSPAEGLHYTSHMGLADQTGAMMLAYATLLGIIARERFGIGQDIDVSQLGSCMTLQALALNRHLMVRDPLEKLGRRAGNPLFNIYRAGDGKWFALAGMQSDRHWADVCRVIGRPELVNDPRFADLEARRQHSAELVAILDKVFVQRPRDEWMELFEKHDVHHTPIQDYCDLEQDPQVLANEYIAELEHPTAGRLKQVGVTVKLSKTPGYPRRTAPEFGQHTEEVLLEHGYTWEQIERWREKGVI